MTTRIYGYARISTMKQRIERQIDNIKREYPTATIITEEYTGTTTDRPNFNKMLKNLKQGDTIVFDEVSRMSRNAAEGIELYEQLFDKGINLVFIKEPHINTSVYRDRMNKQIEKLPSTGSKAYDKAIDGMLSVIHELTIDIAKEQIELAFKTAQAEVDFLHQRTSEGVRKAQAQGKQVGRAAGAKVETKKAKESKARIIELSKDFNGTNSDKDVMKILGLARNTYYKYKAELKAKKEGRHPASV